MKTTTRWDRPVLIASVLPFLYGLALLAALLDGCLDAVVPPEGLRGCMLAVIAAAMALALMAAVRRANARLQVREGGAVAARRIDACVVAVAGFPGVALVVGCPVLLLVLALQAWKLPEGLAAPLAFVCGMAVGGLWTGWRAGRHGALVAALTGAGLAGWVALTASGPDLRSRLLLWVAGLSASAIGGVLGRRLPGADGRTSEEQPEAPRVRSAWPLALTVRIVGVLTVVLWVLFVPGPYYDSLRAQAFRGACASPLDISATGDGRVCVLSGPRRASPRAGLREFYEYDPTGRLLRTRVARDESTKLEQVVLVPDGRILASSSTAVYEVTEDGRLSSLLDVDTNTIEDMVLDGDDLYVLAGKRLLRHALAEEETTSYALGPGAMPPNLARAPNGGCALLLDDVVHVYRRQGQSEIRLQGSTGRCNRLWFPEAGPVVMHSPWVLPMGLLRITAFGPAGAVRGTRALPIWSAGLEDPTEAFPVSLAASDDRLFALNLGPLMVRAFTPALADLAGFSVCDSKWKALLIRAEYSVTTVLGPAGGMRLLGTAISLPDLATILLLGLAVVLLVGEFLFLARVFPDQYGRAPVWVWIVVLLYPWAGTWPLVWRLSLRLMSPGAEGVEEPGEARPGPDLGISVR